jgi:hypothetical protein
MSKKALPVVSTPTLTVVLPVSKLKVKYRPFVIKEQKALLLAQESKDIEAILETIKSVIESCSHGTLDFTKVPTADLAYFFLQLRIASVGPDVRFGVPCVKCGESNTVNMSLEDVKIETGKIVTDVKITNDIGIKFRLPTIEDLIDDNISSVESMSILYKMIDCIYDADSVYQKSDYSEEEFQEWIEGLNDKQIERIKEYTDSIPELKHELKFSCSECGHEQSRLLEGLHNFFRFGDGA